MLNTKVVTKVIYTCTLTDEDEHKVRAYAKENNVSLDEAIQELDRNEDIDVWGVNQIESESWTESVGYSEFNGD